MISISRLKQRNNHAFKELIEIYQKNIYFFVLKICKDPDLTHDIVQETFIKVYEKMDSFREESKLKTWIFRIAANTALRELENIKRRKAVRIDEFNLELDSNSDSSRDLFKTDFHLALEESIELLTPTQKEIFNLRRMEGLSIKAAAKRLSCSEAHIKKQSYLALNRIRDFFIKKYADTEWVGLL
ncbi:MAG: RNA polymerase sigma factor [Calditrichaeota bacterium]|nr:RNA polymerase sigma factor [Calditrichota bacterium]